MSRKAFEKSWNHNDNWPLTNSDSPKCWGGSKEQIAAWKLEPYDNPYANGAFYGWRLHEQHQQAFIDGLQESLDMVVAEAQRLDKLACEQIERIAELEAQQRWIPVSERLPAFGEHCLFVMPTSIDEVVAGFVSDERETRFQDSPMCDLYGDVIGYDADCITYWKPLKLPAPPEGD